MTDKTLSALTAGSGLVSTDLLYGKVGSNSRKISLATLSIFFAATSSALAPSVLVGDGVSVRAAPTVSNRSGNASFFGYQNINGAVWAAGVVTITTALTHNYRVGALANVRDITPSGYNGVVRILSVPSATTFTYALAADPGTYSAGSDFVTLEPDVQFTSSAPNSPALILTAHADAVSLGIDQAVPVFAVIEASGNISNNSFAIFGDGHTFVIRQGGIAKQFSNGLLDHWTSEHTLGWTSTTSSSPDSAANVDLQLGRNGAGNLRQGKVDAATAVSQILSVQNVVAGTSNTAGADRYYYGSQGTGTGAGGAHIFQVAPAGSTGTSQNALATAMTIASNRAVTFASTVVLDGLPIVTNGVLRFSNSDGDVTYTTGLFALAAGTAFKADRFGVGGAASATTFMNLAAGTTGLSQFRMVQGVAPSSPVDGDSWREDNTNTGWKVRINGVTKTVSLV